MSGVDEEKCIAVLNSSDMKDKNLNVKDEKLVAQDNLHACYKDLQESLRKTKLSFSSFRNKCFFYPEREFNKSFKKSLEQVEAAVTEMGKTFSSIIGSNKDTKEDSELQVESKSAIKQEQESFSLGKDQADALAKANLNITPPSSEAGNDDDVGNVTQSQKRISQESEPDGKVVKRPRRSLMDQYSDKGDENSNITSSKEKEETTVNKEAEEEVEYEVDSILCFKKIQSRFFYKVSWKGYSVDDCTWEPSAHLTDCDEALLDFFKRKLIEREKLSTGTEMNNQVLPNDRELVDHLHKAFLASLCQPSEEVLSKIFKQPSLQKSPMKEEELKELIDKALTSRKVDRYNSFKQMLIDQMVLKGVYKERSRQLAELRAWERSINSVCSDPVNITVENDIDLALPPRFTYINELKEGPGVKIPSDPILGCECTDCFNSQNSCCASQFHSSWFAYNKYGRLRVSLGTPIYECNKLCKCTSGCHNRVVQKGMSFRLAIFRTENGRGWGVKALEAIKKDSFVVEYVGEVITSEEAELRGQTYDKKGCTYLFDLDFNKGDQNPYTVDAAKFGNVSHFINHSCDPNLVVFNVWVNCLDPDLPRLALFACRDIKKGEELTFDYNSGLTTEQVSNDSEGSEELEDDVGITPEKPSLSPGYSLKTPKGSRGLQYGKTECRCGAANCRQYFF